MFGALIPPPLSLPTASSYAVRSRPTCAAPSLATEARVSGHRRSSSLYEVLRVKHNATITEIKAAYRSLAKVYHPDTVRLGTEKGILCGREFMEIHDAYSTLSDPAARAVYDLALGFGGRRRHGHGYGNGGRQTRRWETDQCW